MARVPCDDGQLRWTAASQLPDEVVQSSPIVDDIDKTQVALVGSLDGKV